ncbi:MAG: restriction endonuclease subunit S, partial [Candidatus Ratteibacteria bacterium]|nr:restriction endonuclease subunit S [Candidatus Ratteibacteria bacterium]
TLGETVKEIRNGFASGKRDENGIVQIRMNNVTTDGHLIFDSYLKVPIPKNIDEWLLKEGDVLFNNTNSIDLVGKSTVFKSAPFSCTFSNHFTRIRFKKEIILPELILYHFIILWEKGYFKSVAIRHVGQSAVHNQYLINLKIPLPPLPEQKKIAEILSTVDKKLEFEKRRKEKMERIKRGLMEELLTGEKRVKL